MDIVRGNEVSSEIKKILIIGVEKSGKTSFIGTMPRPILIFAGETGAEGRLGGQKDIDFVRCYDLKGEPKGAGFGRFEKNFRELMTMKDFPYKTVAIDPLSFFSDNIVDKIDRTNPGLRGSASTFKFWDLIKTKHLEILSQVLAMSEYVVVTSHVRLRDDETTDKAMFLPDLNGSIRDSIGGWFDAVLFTSTKPMGDKVKYSIQAIPDARRKGGVRVPLGMEGLLGLEEEPDFAKIQAKLVKK